ncbi:MAG: hypothetical protein KA258_05125 [Deltaproteobacteria bacterium]|jgi:hypothetical protein|nr:hypothetical protein [Deltaproteobacteria bacterium]
MRALVSTLSTSMLLWAVMTSGGCAASSRMADRSQLQSELELAFDDGQPAERPLLPNADGEWLVRFEPTLPAYKPQRLRLLVAQPGKLRLTLYRHDDSGRPGAKLTQLERTYEVNHTSSGLDGKWILEPVGEVPILTGPLWLGISVPTSDPSAARLWASRRESGQVFQRDSEPATALQSTKLPMTPMVRLLISAESLPPTPASPPAKVSPQPEPSAKKDKDAK